MKNILSAAIGAWCLLFITLSTPCQSQEKQSKNQNQMMSLSTYLLFDGNCKEAMEFYKSVFGGELALTTVGQSPMKGVFPESMHHKTVNARLTTASVDISASDWLRPTQTPIRGNMTCLYINGGTVGELKAIFGKLSQGADVTDPIREEPFGTYGALNDRFGVRWMFHAAGKE
jgi:PhnB protein